ncbi:unnamed protein product [Pneumocystis jirovecii]|uniref:Uncharacterized protein n=2 Tax=Pneumocystis jirovecii TaxID=42068 RepID=L0PBD1_PNEJI|nr:unnamed protein product [Pneumocystis jirovecii]
MPYLNSSALFEKDRISQVHAPRFLGSLNSQNPTTSTQCFKMFDKASRFFIVKRNWKLSRLTNDSSVNSFNNLTSTDRDSVCTFIGQIVLDRFDKLYASSPMPKLVNEAYFKLSNSFPHGISESFFQNPCLLQQKKIAYNGEIIKKHSKSSVFSSGLKKYDNSCDLSRKKSLKRISQNMLNLNIQKFNNQLNSLIKPDYFSSKKRENVKCLNTLVSDESDKFISTNESFGDVLKVNKTKCSPVKEIPNKYDLTIKNDFHVFFSRFSKCDTKIQRSCITDECRNLFSPLNSDSSSTKGLCGDNKDNELNETYYKKKKKINGKNFDKPLTKRTRFSLTENELKNLSIFGGYISQEKLKRKRRPPGKWWLVSSNCSYGSLERGNTSPMSKSKNKKSTLRLVKNKSDNKRSGDSRLIVNLKHTTNLYDFSD